MIETNSHVLRECSWAREVWRNFYHDSGLVVSHLSFREWFGSILEQGNQETLELFSVIAWQIWGARNELIFEKIATPPDLCYKKAVDHLLKYRKANYKIPANRPSRLNAKWEPPSVGHIKINVDAAINEKEDRFGMGLVVRDVSGSVLMAASKTKWPFISVERAELDAFQWAVEYVKAHNWSHVVLEGDAQNIIHALQRKITRSFHSQIVVDNILSDVVDIDQLSFSFLF